MIRFTDVAVEADTTKANAAKAKSKPAAVPQTEASRPTTEAPTPAKAPRKTKKPA